MSTDSSTTPTWREQPMWDHLLGEMLTKSPEKVRRLVVPSMDESAQDLCRRAVALAWAFGYREVSNVHVVLAALGLRRERELSSEEDRWRTNSIFDALMVKLSMDEEQQPDRRKIGGRPTPSLSPSVEAVLAEALFRVEWAEMTWIGGEAKPATITAVDILAAVVYEASSDAPTDTLLRDVFGKAGVKPEALVYLIA